MVAATSNAFRPKGEKTVDGSNGAMNASVASPAAGETEAVRTATSAPKVVTCGRSSARPARIELPIGKATSRTR
jgi:hypothetical protein